jgi:hypothetical protein
MPRNVLMHLTDGEVATCRAWHEILLRNSVTGTMSLGSPDRFFVGLRGEFAFRAWLVSESTHFRYHVDLRAFNATPEFTVRVGGKAQLLDVKTRSHVSNDHFLTPKTTALNADYYVAAKVTRDPRDILLCGWCTRAEVERMPISIRFDGKTPTRYAKLASLRDMQTLRLDFSELNPEQETAVTESEGVALF